MAIAAEGSSDLFIDGKLTGGGAGRFATVNPATEEVLGTAANADAADMDRAIAAARRAFDGTDWARDTELRVRCIRQLREAMREHIEELREITMAEVGAPRMLTAAAQLQGPVEDLGFSADTAESYPWRTDLGVAAPMGIKTQRTVVREAVGVVGAITPWNFPHQINLAKIGPALAAGNTVVLKPAPDTPWCAAILGELVVAHTDIPPGVLNIVTSDDHAVGAMLTSDPRVDMVSFTGSTATGRAVMEAGAPTVKKVFLELGGKSAFIVLDDADLASACAMAGFTASMHAGQGCAITTRLWCRGPAMTMPSPPRPPQCRVSSPVTPPSPERSVVPLFPRASATECSLIWIWRSPKAAVSRAAAVVRQTGTAASSSSRR